MSPYRDPTPDDPRDWIDPPTDENVSPRTEAGRALLDLLHPLHAMSRRNMLSGILAIEREAPSLATPALDVERLAEGLHAEQANREVGCGNHTEAYDDHMDRHRGQAERILRFVARLQHPDSDGDAR